MFVPLRSLLILLLVGVAAAENYIVVLKPGLGSVIDTLVKTVLGIVLNPLAKWNLGTFSGFVADLTPAQVSALLANPSVSYVEKDGKFTTFGVMKRHSISVKRATTTQSSASWGLGRISHHAKGSTNYVYDASAGSGTCIYILDSGIYAHSDFNGRLTHVGNYINSESSSDLSGHGTAVAGVAAGTTYGVAKSAQIYNIKVCDQSGSCDVSSVVSGISLATNDSGSRSCPNGVIINLSLGGPSSSWQSMRQAVTAAANANIFVVAAAGNDHANVANYLPASAAGACSVGATDSNDAIASFSNYGSSLAIFAPGVAVVSAGIAGSSASVSADGTSMSAPFVAGLGAYLWTLNGKGSTTPYGVALCNTIKNVATTSAITGNLGGSSNRLAYNNNGL